MKVFWGLPKSVICENAYIYLTNNVIVTKYRRRYKMIKQNTFQIITDEEASRYKFAFCKLCKFYECELVEEYVLFKKNNQDIDFPSYDQNDLANGCPMKKFVQIECGRKRVAHGIGDHFKINTRHNFEIETDTDKWEPNQPVFISAQTGQGKNYFVEKTLLPYVRDLNRKKRTDQKILIISNRIALRLQITNRIKNNGQDVEEDSIYSYGDFADVVSYQSILNRAKDLTKKQKRKISKYLFVICDETHFFTSDAIFNPYTDQILENIVSIFKDAIRIYMSATPYECIDYIRKCEYKNSDKTQLGVFYHFKRNYSYLDVKYYSSNKELTDIIISSGNERWLIFIDNTNECERFKKILETAGQENIEKSQTNAPGLKGQVFTVSAKSKYNPKFQKMILNESFDNDTKVLIATSVIDNGVSFRGINNIVVSDVSKVKCLQMVGRSRVDNSDDKITLYIKRFNEKDIERMIIELMDKQNAYHRYDLAYKRPWDNKTYYYEAEFINTYYDNKEEEWEIAKHLFARNQNDPKKLIFNTIARSLIDEKLDSKYKAILEEMQRTNEGLKISGQKYLEYQLSWFGKKYDRANDITLVDKNAARDEFITFLETTTVNEVKLFGTVKKEFRENFTRLHDKVFPRRDPNLKRIYGNDTINQVFNEHNMNYALEVVPSETVEGKKISYWKIVKFNREHDV